ncbi:hypothetical protein I4U23_021707 [Adineta vaga]|nr:hypothetical protein I4U23_021707 [Adineta vaga]
MDLYSNTSCNRVEKIKDVIIQVTIHYSIGLTIIVLSFMIFMMILVLSMMYGGPLSNLIFRFLPTLPPTQEPTSRSRARSGIFQPAMDGSGDHN